MNPRDLDPLIDACLEGSLSESEAEQLSAALEDSPEVRTRYWELASVHGLLEQGLQQASLRAITGQGAASRWRPGNVFRWNPLTAAAAGVVVGICSATMVWAYTAPFANRAAREKAEVFFDSFEDEGIEMTARFPNRAGVWSGNLSLASPLEENIPSFKGKGMVKLTPVATRKFAYAWRILDLADYPPAEAGQTRQLELTASFCSAETAHPARYQIRLAAFSQDPSAVRRIWNHEAVLFDTVLQHVGRNVVTEKGDRGWRKMRANLEIPAGARSVVISLGAAAGGESQEATEHYLDAVRARFVFTQTPQD